MYWSVLEDFLRTSRVDRGIARGEYWASLRPPLTLTRPYHRSLHLKLRRRHQHSSRLSTSKFAPVHLRDQRRNLTRYHSLKEHTRNDPGSVKKKQEGKNKCSSVNMALFFVTHYQAFDKLLVDISNSCSNPPRQYALPSHPCIAEPIAPFPCSRMLLCIYPILFSMQVCVVIRKP